MTDELQRLADLYDKTTSGYRNSQGARWLEAWSLDGLNTPKIANCVSAGNWVSPAVHREVASFTHAGDRDFVLAVHAAFPVLLKELQHLRAAVNESGQEYPNYEG